MKKIIRITMYLLGIILFQSCSKDKSFEPSFTFSGKILYVDNISIGTDSISLVFEEPLKLYFQENRFCYITLPEKALRMVSDTNITITHFDDLFLVNGPNIMPTSGPRTWGVPFIEVPNGVEMKGSAGIFVGTLHLQGKGVLTKGDMRIYFHL